MCQRCPWPEQDSPLITQTRAPGDTPRSDNAGLPTIYNQHNQHVKPPKLPASVDSSPASLGELTGTKYVVQMHFNSTTHEARVRTHGILH